MTSVVIDASVTLAWCFPDEGSGYADAVLVELKGNSILVPAVWALEVANGILVGERSKRLRQPEIRRFITLLENLSVVQDVQSLSENVRSVLPLARDHGLSAYDAAYLELSVRYNTPLATLDRKLRKAGRSAGVKLYAEESA